MAKKSSIGYVGRDGARMKKEAWTEHSCKPEYVVVRHYDNDKVRAIVEWVGKVPNIDSTWGDMWKVLKFEVWNIRDNGEWALDPVESDKWFPSQDKAIEYYEKFIEQWTAAHRDESGHLVEEDNIYYIPPPPPPPDPDAPTSDCSSIKGLVDDGVGAW
jgi:hypothetical protein